MKFMRSSRLLFLIPALWFGCVPLPDIDLTIPDMEVEIQEFPSQGQIIDTATYVTNSGRVEWSIVSQSPQGAFAIDPQRGIITVADSSLFSISHHPTLSATLEGYNQGTTARAQLMVTLTPANTNLTVSDFNAEVEENPANGTVLGRLSVTGAEGNQTISLSDQSPAGALAINHAGFISIADGSLFVFAENPTITATATVQKGGQEATATLTITVQAPSTGGPTIWSGPTLSFSKSNGSNPTQEANQDRLTDNVWITRGNSGGQIYNIVTESTASSSVSPEGTEWAIGALEDWESLTFEPFRSAVGSPKNVVGKNLVLHLIEDDIYLEVQFTSWATRKQGGFAYDRSTPEE